MNFVAIDFETANRSRSSACSMAAVTVENGQVVRSAYSLIRPAVLRFDYWNTRIHGITAADVADKPTFAELWERIRPHLENKIVIAHNATFDIGVLRTVLDEYQLRRPSFRYACTVEIARKVWPEIENYKLSTLAKQFAFVFEHHNALHDARACAQIAIEARRTLRAESFLQLATMVQVPVRDFN
ncbi:3'-5' exonuclease [Lucifera butyrica]|nr:3'-5' exonuclease [Lucifera butyrica]